MIEIADSPMTSLCKGIRDLLMLEHDAVSAAVSNGDFQENRSLAHLDPHIKATYRLTNVPKGQADWPFALVFSGPGLGPSDLESRTASVIIAVYTRDDDRQLAVDEANNRAYVIEQLIDTYRECLTDGVELHGYMTLPAVDKTPDGDGKPADTSAAWATLIYEVTYAR